MSALLPAIKAANQDHEFYPTTDEIISALVQDLRKNTDEKYNHRSVLDIGAGNGKVLRALRAAGIGNQFFAIEKSPILCQELDADILIVGTEFHEQSLFSKRADVIFCNPPYSEFASWATKIIREAAAPKVYLVIPDRWDAQVSITDALRFRSANARKLGEFDFENAEDRQARARVHLLRIDLTGAKDDAFERFFEEQFADLIARFEAPVPAESDNAESRGGGRHRPFANLVPGPNYPEALVSLYTREMANVQRNYQLVGELDAELLREFEISPSKIMALLKQRLSGLRNDYWKELFDHLGAITSRLTSKSRRSLLDTLNQHVHVDFTVSNIFAIVIWAIKNANRYIDSQLLDTYDLMVDKCNVRLYKSNQRTWEEDRWRYNNEPRKNSHFSLDYRIVTHRIGGIRTGYAFERGLAESACEFMGDLLTLANNLGFRTDERSRTPLHDRRDWQSNHLQVFHSLDACGRSIPIFNVRAFLNGNLHLRLNKAFILALNVEHGRLKGWLHSGEEAAVELQDPNAAKYFRSNFQLPASNPTHLLAA